MFLYNTDESATETAHSIMFRVCIVFVKDYVIYNNNNNNNNNNTVKLFLKDFYKVFFIYADADVRKVILC